MFDTAKPNGFPLVSFRTYSPLYRTRATNKIYQKSQPRVAGMRDTDRGGVALANGGVMTREYGHGMNGELLREVSRALR